MINGAVTPEKARLPAATAPASHIHALHSEPSSTRTLIDELLEAQQQLQTPVARFSNAHDRGDTPSLEPIYRDLIPLTAPRPGEQYAFEVDLDACSGCKACVAGCHSLNGLDDEETWRDVGLIHGGTRSHPFQQTVTTACHHCADPGCLNGCPVLAYEKDPITGIVRHLDDQCIGCQYCILKCPYDVPKYNERLGIVRKCDMCHGRLGAGEAPACVQACPTHAIKIVTVTTHVNGALSADTSAFLPTAPSPHYTLPTTRYVTKRALPDNIMAADAELLRLQPAHWPLVIMLTFMPMAVACLFLAVVAPRHAAKLTEIGWIAAAIGLASSFFHLGQPFRAWRIFLGLRKSWLSREAVIFGGWFALVSILAAAHFPLTTGFLPPLPKFLGFTAAAIGLLGLFCSVMIYVDTRREFWRFAQTAPRFFGTAGVLGLGVLFALEPNPSNTIAVITLVLCKLAIETRVLRSLDDDDEKPTEARQTALLLTGLLRLTLSTRYFLALIGAGLIPLLVTLNHMPTASAWAGLTLALGGELIERYTYFRAVAVRKMPGVVSS